MKHTLVIFLFVLLHSGSYSQSGDTVFIVPGDNFLQSAQLTDYKIKYDFILFKNGTETKVGGLEDNFQIITRGKEKLGLRICHIRFGANSILDSGLCILKGLAPIYHRSIQTNKILSLNFNSESVNGYIISITDTINKKEAIQYKTSTPLFDSYYEDMIAKTIQFKKGLTFKFAEYIYERGGIVWSSGEVVNKEKKTNGDWVWKVVFYEKNSEGKTQRTTTYLIKELDREIISREYKTETSRILMRQG